MVVKGSSRGGSFAQTARMPLKKIKGLVKTGKSKTPKSSANADISIESKVTSNESKDIAAPVAHEGLSSNPKIHGIDGTAEEVEQREAFVDVEPTSTCADSTEELEQRDEIEPVKDATESSVQPFPTNAEFSEVDAPAFMPAAMRAKIEQLETEAINAATKIQSHVRMTQAVKAYIATVSSIILIQSFARQRAAQEKLRITRIATNAAIAIQKNARVLCCQKHYKATVSSIILVQTLARVQAAKKNLQLRITRIATNAAIAIQKNARVLCCQKHYKATVSSIILVQTLARVQAAKKNLRVAVDAATKLQSLARKRSAQEAFATSKNAAMIIQKNARMVACKSSYKATLSSIIKVQSLVRKRAVHKELLIARDAAIIVQKNARRALSKYRFKGSLTSILLIQTLARQRIQTLARQRAAEKDLEEAKDAAAKTQSLSRMQAVERAFATLRKPAIVIQKNVRMIMCTKSYKATLASIIKIQALARQRAAAKVYNSWDMTAKRKFLSLRSTIATVELKPLEMSQESAKQLITPITENTFSGYVAVEDKFNSVVQETQRSVEEAKEATKDSFYGMVKGVEDAKEAMVHGTNRTIEKTKDDAEIKFYEVMKDTVDAYNSKIENIADFIGGFKV